MDDSAAGVIFWRGAGIHSARKSHSELWGFSSHWVYIGCTLVFCGALWDWMSALENIHYGFKHHLKWLSPQIVHYRDRSVLGAHAFCSVPGAHAVRSRARFIPGAHAVRSRARSIPRAHTFRFVPGAHAVCSRARSIPRAHVFRSVPGAHAVRSIPGAHRVRSSARSSPWAHRVRSRARSSLWAHRVCSRARSSPWVHRVRSRARSSPWAHRVRSRARSSLWAHRAHSSPGAHRVCSRARSWCLQTCSDLLSYGVRVMLTVQTVICLPVFPLRVVFVHFRFILWLKQTILLHLSPRLISLLTFPYRS